MTTEKKIAPKYKIGDKIWINEYISSHWPGAEGYYCPREYPVLEIEILSGQVFYEVGRVSVLGPGRNVFNRQENGIFGTMEEAQIHLLQEEGKLLERDFERARRDLEDNQAKIVHMMKQLSRKRRAKG